MLITVIGGSGSGKSEFAENIAIDFNNQSLYYIATMKPYGAEALSRIERHRKMREKKGFETIECYNDLNSIKIKGAVILLECMSNLVANAIFDVKNKQPVFDIMQAVNALAQENILIVVTNDVFSDGCEYDSQTVNYIKTLSEINKKLIYLSCKAVEVVCGIPIIVKEEM